MAEENNQNQQKNQNFSSSQAGDGQVQPKNAADPARTRAANVANNKGLSKKNDSTAGNRRGNKGRNDGNKPKPELEQKNNDLPPKKVKTARQIERERERRRRRRRNKSLQKQAGLNLKPGQDVPLIMSSDSGDDQSLPPPDLTMKELDQSSQKQRYPKDEDFFLKEEETEKPAAGLDVKVESEARPEPLLEETELNEEVKAEPVSEEEQKIVTKEEKQTKEEVSKEEETQLTEAEITSEKENKPEAEEEIEDEAETEVKTETAEGAETEFKPEDTTKTEIETDKTFPEQPLPASPDLADLDKEEADQNTTNEPLGMNEPGWETDESDQAEQVPTKAEVVEGVPVVLSKDEEEKLKTENIQRAKEISENLLVTEDEYDELPQKPDLLGRFFDFLHRLFGKKEKLSESSTFATVASPDQLGKDHPSPDEVMASEANQSLESTNAEPPKKISWLVSLVKFIIYAIILGFLAVGFYWLGSSLKLFDRLNSYFSTNPELVLVQGDNSKVIYDEGLLKKLGFQTGVIMGKNLGNIQDLAYNVFYNAVYFGKLREPILYVETGVSAALYYGFGKDEEYIKNRFIYYVKFLTELNNVYSVNVYNVMSGKVDRDAALQTFINSTQALYTKGLALRREILVQVDDLTTSLNTINPDKTKYEADFFAALANMEAENSDMLIKKFIEITQRQVEIKAKLAAMTKLAQMYEQILINIKVRLDAVIKNRAALVEGIQVTPIPGSNLNLVKTQ